jgi:hypothetical protein
LRAIDVPAAPTTRRHGEFETVTFIAGHTQETVPSTGSRTWFDRAMGQITFYSTSDLESSLRRLGNGDWVGNEDPAGLMPYRRGPRR